MSLHSLHYPMSSSFDDQIRQSYGVCVCVCTQVEWTGIGRGGLVRAIVYRSTQIWFLVVTALTTLPHSSSIDDKI